MAALKSIHRDAIPRALDKAERYRLLNEPVEAESICRDVLAADPGNRQAIVCLLLATTDLFALGHGDKEEARALAASLTSEYDREYYAGVVDERWAKALHHRHRSIEKVHETIRRAMTHFDRASKLAAPGDDDAILRWNTCVRLLERIDAPPERDHDRDRHAHVFDEDVPLR